MVDVVGSGEWRRRSFFRGVGCSPQRCLTYALLPAGRSLRMILSVYVKLHGAALVLVFHQSG